MRRTSALIVGGGPAGAATAIRLAEQGARPVVLERLRETGDALCGGFLSWRTLEALARLGIEADALNPARIARVRIFSDGTRIEGRLPAPALAVSRRRLDTLMLARAEMAGAGVERGVTVRAIAGCGARTGDGAAIAADALFLASGKHDVRGVARATPDADPTLGLRVHIAASASLAASVGGAVELHLFRGGYAGFALQEDGRGNLCLAARRSVVMAAGGPGSFLRTIDRAAPSLSSRIDGMEDRFDAVANIPYGWRARGTEAGVFRLGDQAGVIPSLAGEGMGIAIASGVAAANAFAGGGADAAERWQRDFACRLRRPIAVAGLVRDAAATPLLGLARVPGLMQIIAIATRADHDAP